MGVSSARATPYSFEALIWSAPISYFVQLLEGDADRLGKVMPSETDLGTAQASAGADNKVDGVLLQLSQGLSRDAVVAKRRS